MSATVAVLIGIVVWPMLLVLSLGMFRLTKVMADNRAPNSFSASGDDLIGFGRRLTRAHANAYEFLPFAGLALLLAVATESTMITDPLAWWFLLARVAQSLVHIASTSNPAVLVRFLFFATQVGIVLWWAWGLSQALI